MHDDLLVGHDILAVLVNKLLVRGGAVHAGCYEDAHTGLGGGGMDAAQQDRHRHARGNGARVVGADDDDVLLASAEFLELGRAVGIVEGILDELLLVLARLELVLVPLHKPGEVLLVEAQMHSLVVIGQIKLIHGVRSFFLTRCRSGHGIVGEGYTPRELPSTDDLLPFAVIYQEGNLLRKKPKGLAGGIEAAFIFANMEGL